MSDDDQQPIAEEQQYRAGAYSLLAALLRAAPDPMLLEHLQQLSPQGDTAADELAEAMAGLAAAAADAEAGSLEDEYHALFIGMGRGEIVPYGSWYLTGFLMEQPLSDLRDDLAELGFERAGDVSEPEDHVSALFEVFSGMIVDHYGHGKQLRFFETHMQPWLARFFSDLEKAGSANFYKRVARFGAAFVKLETDYLSMRS